jgi:hypothetical protein
LLFLARRDSLPVETRINLAHHRIEIKIGG